MFTNYFNYPQYYRNELLKYKCLDVNVKDRYKGKSLMYAFLTRFCYVGCDFCFNRSQCPGKKGKISDQFSDRGIDRLIAFCEKADLGCLIISGGGDPFLQKTQVLRLVKEAKASRIVLVTSGFWAKSEELANDMISDIYRAFSERKETTELVVRISISEYHSKALGVDCALNVLKVFDKHYRNNNNFKLQLKSFDNDKAFDLFLSKLDFESISEVEENVSDNFVIEKILRKKRIIKLKSGMEIIVGFSEIFYTSVFPNLFDDKKVSYVTKTVDDDLLYSVKSFPATILNTDGSVGLNWSLYYNGNICLWQSQARDTYQSIYEDDYDHVISAHFNDPLVYSFIDKGNEYRESIVKEISPLSIKRAKATGLRDRLGLYLLEDERVRLYYMVRAIQDYMSTGEIDKSCFSDNEVLDKLVKTSPAQLQNLFKASTFDALAQEMQKPFDKDTFLDFLCCVKLGHFDLSNERKMEALDWYNKHVPEKRLKNFEEIDVVEDASVYKRVGDRQMSIKDSIIAYK